MTVYQQVAFRIDRIMERNGFVGFTFRWYSIHNVERVLFAADDRLITSGYRQVAVRWRIPRIHDDMR